MTFFKIIFCFVVCFTFAALVRYLVGKLSHFVK